MQSLRSILILFIMAVSTYSQTCTIDPFNTTKIQPVCTLDEFKPSDLTRLDYLTIIIPFIIFYYSFLIFYSYNMAHIIDYINILPKKPETTFWWFWLIYNMSNKPPTDIIQVLLINGLLYISSLFFTTILQPKDSKTMFFYCYLYYLLL